MKFLWIFTATISIFFAYHTYTHTRIRYKDLESVMQQNLAIRNGIDTIKRTTQKQFTVALALVEKQGHSPKDVEILTKARAISTFIDTMLKVTNYLPLINSIVDKKISLPRERMEFIIPFYTTIPNYVATRDTILKDLNDPIYSLLDTKSHYFPFFQQRNLRQSYSILRIERRGVDMLVARVGSVGSPIDMIFAMASAKSQIIEIGRKYEAKMILITNRTQLRPKMQISEGMINIKGYVGEIEIKNVKAQNYNSEGKATKTLTGKITIKKADGSDTTFTLSKSYTIKKLVN